jgi:DNA-binding GntR family transcriptional regulator
LRLRLRNECRIPHSPNCRGALEPLATSPILVDQVYRRLLGAIADRTLRPGQRILQAELATSLGVSRQPVSHALQLLKHQGLVQDSGRQGLEVAPIDAGRIRQLYEVRGALDALSARLAADRAAAGALSADLVAALRAALAAGAALGARATLTQLVQVDVEFHQVLYRLSGNPAIPETIAAQWPHMRRSMGTVLEADSYRRRAWAEHAEIARLILAGESEAASKAAYQHADDAGKLTEQRLLREDPSG